MRTTHFDRMLKQQERAQAAAARRSRARTQAKAASKPAKAPVLDLLSNIFLVVGIAVAAGAIAASFTL